MRAGKKALIAKRLLLAAMTAALIGGTASTAFAAEPKMHSRLVNGSMENFSYNRVAGIATPPSIYADTYIDVHTGRFYYTTYGNAWRNIPNWNFSDFGWTSTQPGGTFDGYQVPAGTVQINYDRATHNAYAELTIHTDSAIYQAGHSYCRKRSRRCAGQCGHGHQDPQCERGRSELRIIFVGNV